MARGFWLLLLVVVTVKAEVLLPTPRPMSDWTEGTASFFGGPQEGESNVYTLEIANGSCGYGNIDNRLYPFYYVAGLHATNPLVKSRPMHACGTCVEIACVDARKICNPGMSITAMITDRCVNDCSENNINLHAFAFEKLASNQFGRIDIMYRLVECDPVDHVTVNVDQYRESAGGWMRVTFRNVYGDGALVRVEASDALNVDKKTGKQNWFPMKNTFGAVWEISGLNTSPFKFRLTNSDGQTVILSPSKNITEGFTGSLETTSKFGPVSDEMVVKNPRPLADVTKASQGDLLGLAAPKVPAHFYSKRIDNKTVKGDIIVKVDQYRKADGGWIRLQFDNVAGGANSIIGVELADGTGSAASMDPHSQQNFWRTMNNTFDDYWEYNGLPSEVPFQLKLLNLLNEELLLERIIPYPVLVGDYVSTKQFSLSPSNTNQSMPVPSGKARVDPALAAKQKGGGRRLFGLF